MINRLHRHLILIFLTVASTSYAASLSGTVENTNSVSLYYISNFITGEKTTVAQSLVGEDGQYQFSFETTELRTYYVNLGSRIAQVVIESEQDLILDLPDYAPLRKAEYLNPYFEQEIVLVYDNSIEDLNYHQMQIELLTARQLKRVLESASPSYTANSALDSIISIKENTKTIYLSDYLNFSEATFYQMAHPENIKAIKQKYLRNAEPKLQNTAFTKLFLSEYHNPFLAPDGIFYQNVSNVIVEGQLTDNFIASIASTLKIKNPIMAELVTIKGFYDAAMYAPSYQRTITELMVQLESQLQDPRMIDLCKTSRIKIERLMVGNSAPYYELFTLKGKKVPTILKRKTVLLAFVNTNIFECQKQLRLLEKYKEAYKRHLEVVVVAVYQDEKELERFLKRNSFENIYFTLWQNNEQLLVDYNVKSLPSYYLTGRDGKIIYAPLSSPEENMLEELQSVVFK